MSDETIYLYDKVAKLEEEIANLRRVQSLAFKILEEWTETCAQICNNSYELTVRAKELRFPTPCAVCTTKKGEGKSSKAYRNSRDYNPTGGDNMNDCRDCIQYVYMGKSLLKVRPTCKIDPNIIPSNSIYCGKFEDKREKEKPVTTTKTKQLIWHECEGSPLEDPDKDDTGISLTMSSCTGKWYLTADCHESLHIHYCPWCGRNLATGDKLKES